MVSEDLNPIIAQKVMDNSFDGSRLKLRHIQCFIAVAQSRSLQRAAERLSITQPAVSKTLTELEDVVGMKLFLRGRRGAELTAEGIVFAPYASACLANLRDGVGKLLSRAESSPVVVKVGILPTVASVIFPSALAEFQRKWPRATVKVVTASNAELLEQLKAAEIEFVIGRLGEPSSIAGMSFEHLFREPLTVVVHASHALLEPAALTPDALASHLLLVPPAGTLIRQSAESILAGFGMLPSTGRVESLSVSLNLALTLSNNAVWFVPSSLVELKVKAGELVQLPLPFGGTDEPIGLIRRTDQHLSPAAAYLLDMLRSVGLAREQARTFRA